MHVAYVGLGSNLGDRFAAIGAALAQLRTMGSVAMVSSIYRTQPWGRTDQPWFANGVAQLQTELSARALLHALKAAERRLGRRSGERWGPRSIDLDLLLYDDLVSDEPDLVVPHPRLRERAFALVPLAEIDPSFASLRDALSATELSSVERLDWACFARANTAAVESESVMPDDLASLRERIRKLAEIFADDDVVRLKIERSQDEIELRRATDARRSGDGPSAQSLPARLDTIKADLVGVFHLARPAPNEGETFESDREIGFIEALGIRTPVHTMGIGRLISIEAADGEPVEYGQPLFVMARG